MAEDFVSLDFETYSDVNLTKTGVYRYVESRHTGVSRAGYAFNYEPVQLWKPGETAPERLLAHVAKGGRVHAWNAQFEWVLWNSVCTKRWRWPALTREQTWCTQAQALVMGLPASLDHCAEALGLDSRVDPGKRRRMLKFCKPVLINVDGSIVWYDNPAEARLFDRDCMTDVEIERRIGSRLAPMPERERRIYLLDQKINQTGIKLDLPLVTQALAVVNRVAKDLDAECAALTDGFVSDTRKRRDLINWLWLHTDATESITTIDKHAVLAALKNDNLDETVRAVLELRQEGAKSSTAKLKAMVTAASSDHRLRGSLQYYGARQTGRWAGRLVQTHNLPRGHLHPAEIDAAVAAVMTGEPDLIRMLFGSPLDLISSLLRPCFVAAEGHDLMAVDFNAIECRVLAWLAGQQSQLRAFEEKRDPYKLMASAIFDVPIDEVTPEQRSLGKTVVLACGYQLSGRTLQARLALDGVEVDRDFANHMVGTYRSTNSNIVDCWGAMDDASKAAIRNPGTVFASERVKFCMQRNVLYMRLPSGRSLSYLRPEIGMAEFEDEETGRIYEREQIFYWGVDPVTYRWSRQYTYGGKLVENWVQAVARDLLADAMLRIDAAGYPLVLHVHDEPVVEVRQDRGSLDELTALVVMIPDWAKGCPIAAKGWRSKRYHKD